MQQAIQLSSEDTVFSAVSVAIDELNHLVKKLTSGNINHILITSDHGFIYKIIKLTIVNILESLLKERI